MTSQLTRKSKLGLLVCGHSPDKVIEVYGRYDTLFKNLLGAEHFSYQTFFVVDNEFPSSADDADAWLISGSKHGAYEDLPWIKPLESLIQQIYAKRIPLVGICFGHQIMAQALGGRVLKHDGGWIAGVEQYKVDIETGKETGKETGTQPVVLNAWHQDQVVELPADARVIGTSDSCANAALMYNKNTVSLQPHPEFENAYMKLLLAERGDALPAERRLQAEQSLQQTLTNKNIALWLTKVLTRTNF